MHELSIALSLLDVAAEEAEKLGAVKVVAIRLKLGALSGVVKEALLSAFAVARGESAMAECVLVIEEVPVVGYCLRCDGERAVRSVQEMRCGVCGEAVGEVVGGRELEVVGLEIIDASADTI